MADPNRSPAKALDSIDAKETVRDGLVAVLSVALMAGSIELARYLTDIGPVIQDYIAGTKIYFLSGIVVPSFTMIAQLIRRWVKDNQNE